jgi:hypothetical protein
MQDIMTRWPKVTVTATLQCAGNRRDGLAAVKEVKGVIWQSGAISTVSAENSSAQSISKKNNSPTLITSLGVLGDLVGPSIV